MLQTDPATGSYTQDWLYLATDWNWRLVPQFSGKSRAIADIDSHWCDCIQFVTAGLKIKKICADFSTVHKNRMKSKKQVENYSGKILHPSDYEAMPINTDDLFELKNSSQQLIERQDGI